MVLPAWPVAGLQLSTPVEEDPWIAGVQGNAALLDMAMSSTDNRLCTRSKHKNPPFLLPVSPDQVSWGLRVGKVQRWVRLVVSQQWCGAAGGCAHSWRSQQCHSAAATCVLQHDSHSQPLWWPMRPLPTRGLSSGMSRCSPTLSRKVAVRCTDMCPRFLTDVPLNSPGTNSGSGTSKSGSALCPTTTMKTALG